MLHGVAPTNSAVFVPELADVPLEVHASYSREEILAALGFASHAPHAEHHARRRRLVRGRKR